MQSVDLTQQVGLLLQAFLKISTCSGFSIYILFRTANTQKSSRSTEIWHLSKHCTGDCLITSDGLCKLQTVWNHLRFRNICLNTAASLTLNCLILLPILAINFLHITCSLALSSWRNGSQRFRGHLMLVNSDTSIRLNESMCPALPVRKAWSLTALLICKTVT